MCLFVKYQFTSVYTEKSDQEETRRIAMEERLMEIFILTILLLYIVIGCWTGDMVLVAGGGAIGLVLVLGFRK